MNRRNLWLNVPLEVGLVCTCFRTLGLLTYEGFIFRVRLSATNHLELLGEWVITTIPKATVLRLATSNMFSNDMGLKFGRPLKSATVNGQVAA